MQNAIGIDLGTTFSVVGFFDQDGRCRTIPNSEGDLTTPSVVYFDSDQPIVGKEAVKAGSFEPGRCAFLAKRDMGKNHYHREILDQSIPPEVIQALVLKKLRDDASIQLGEVSRAVITVPAYFNEPRRKATQDAGKLAGLDVLDIINEPTAAAIAYGVQEGFLDDQGSSASRELILVYDLGGGTFDATLMEIEGASYRALSTGGDVHLGGVDWDRRIADHVANEFRKQHGFDPRNDPSANQELIREAEDAKRALTARTVTTLHIAHGGKRMRMELNRDQLKELTDDLTSRTIFTCKKVLSDAKRSWSDVTRVLAVGGSSRMPLVQEALEAESGMTVDRSLAPDEAVAHGAAIFARLKSEGHVEAIANLNVTNVSSHDLGVLGVERATGMPRRKILIPRNSPLPAKGAGRFVTRSDGQADVAVKVIEGGDASGNHSTPIGRFLVENIPPGTKKGAPIVVKFTYQQDGRLDVSASVSGAEGAGTMSVERASGLDDAEIELWKSKIDRNQVIQQPSASETPVSGPVDANPGMTAPAGPPNPAAAMAAAPVEPVPVDPVSTNPAPVDPAPAPVDTGPTTPTAPAAGSVQAADSPDAVNFDALLDGDDDLLGEDPDDLLGEDPNPFASDPLEDPDQPAAQQAAPDAPTVFEQASESPTIETPVPTPENVQPETPQETVAFDGPLFVEQPVVDTPAVDTPTINTGTESGAPAEAPHSERVFDAEAVEAAPQPVVEQPVVEQQADPTAVVDAPANPVAQPAIVTDQQAPQAQETEAPAVGEPAETAAASEAPTPEQLGLDENPQGDVALGSLDFLEAEEEQKSGEDDNDLQDFFSSLQ